MLLRSIRTRLLGLVVATVVPFIGLIGAGLWHQWRNDQTAAFRRAIDEARLLAAQVDDHVSNLDNLMAGLSRGVSWDAKDTAANDAVLRRLKAELPNYVSAVLLFAVDGTNIGTSSNPQHERANAHDRAYFSQIVAGAPFAIGDVIRARPSGDWVITVSRPIRDDSGQLRAVLAVGTLLEHFQDLLRVKRLPPDSVVQVVSQTGIVIANSAEPNRWIGQNLSKTALGSPMVTAKEVSDIVQWPDGVTRITASATALSAPWLVSVGLPIDIARGPMIQRLTLSSIYTLATVIVAFGIAWTLSGRIVRPLKQLRDDASALAGGELNHRSAVNTDDEVGVLADAFNRMAASLNERQREAARAADELRHAKDTLATVIDASPVAIVCSDLDRRIFIWSRAAEHIFGYSAEEAAGQLATMVPPKRAGESSGLFDRAIKGETIRDLHLKRRRKDGAMVDVRAAAAPIYNPDGSVRGVARAYEDITDKVRAEQQLNRIAHYDQLTGLPNRLTLQKELGRLLAGDSAEPATIALFDLDGFKDVNDTLGHSVGDQLLIEVGHRLSETAGRRGQVCRLGGDEFVVIIPRCGDPLTAGDIVGLLLKRLAEPYKVDDHILHLGGSAGIAIAPADGRTVDELIANADLALYQAKAEGGRASRFFLPVLRAQAQARHSLGLELRRAFADNEFELYFQPQMRLADEAVVGAEALIRWRHPERGILAPGAFIDTLAASAIAPQVSRWIIRSACEQMAGWRSAGFRLARIGVNLFHSQLGDEALLQDIEDALRATGIPAETLELEITENVALNFEHAAVLQKLAGKGVKLAFDDFGTGYASLSYLTRFPLSRIKIDRSFVGRITEDAGDAAIVRSLIAMAHNLGLEVIAEGVETRAQAGFLLTERCEEAQGFLYAKPLPAAGFESFLKTRQLASDPATACGSRVNREASFASRGGRRAGRRRLPAV